MTRYTFVDEAITYINALADRHGADEFCVEARRPRILAAPVNSAAHTLQHPHLAAQKYWVDADQPGVGLLRRPGAPYQLSATPRGRISARPRRSGSTTTRSSGGCLRRHVALYETSRGRSAGQSTSACLYSPLSSRKAWIAEAVSSGDSIAIARPPRGSSTKRAPRVRSGRPAVTADGGLPWLAEADAAFGLCARPACWVKVSKAPERIVPRRVSHKRWEDGIAHPPQGWTESWNARYWRYRQRTDDEKDGHR